jgi:hypothetical protein
MLITLLMLIGFLILLWLLAYPPTLQETRWQDTAGQHFRRTLLVDTPWSQHKVLLEAIDDQRDQNITRENRSGDPLPGRGGIEDRSGIPAHRDGVTQPV